LTWQDVASRFEELAGAAERAGLIGAVEIAGIRLLPQQDRYLRTLLAPLSERSGQWSTITAVSVALTYHPSELAGIPAGRGAEHRDWDAWNRYAKAYLGLNESVTGIAATLAADFGGVAEGATLEGRAGKVAHVSDYYPHCVSHRAFAAAAGLGWIGRHGLLVTPEAGPAIRLATVFLPSKLEAPPPKPGRLKGCGSCRACLDSCSILERAAGQDDADLYREACLRRITALSLEADVCGICVRACFEAVAGRSG